MEEHLTLSRTHATDRFHKKLAQADHSLVTIETTHVKHFSNRAEAEDFEMKLLENDSKIYPKLMLNTRHKRKEVKQIKEANVNTITEAEYREMTEDKKIKVNVTVDEDRQRILLRYTVDGKRESKQINYKACGYEKGMEKANQFIEKFK